MNRYLLNGPAFIFLLRSSMDNLLKYCIHSNSADLFKPHICNSAFTKQRISKHAVLVAPFACNAALRC